MFAPLTKCWFSQSKTAALLWSHPSLSPSPKQQLPWHYIFKTQNSSFCVQVHILKIYNEDLLLAYWTFFTINLVSRGTDLIKKSVVLITFGYLHFMLEFDNCKGHTAIRAMFIKPRWRALPFVLRTQPDKTDGVLTAWMGGCGGKEGRSRGWHRQLGGGEEREKGVETGSRLTDGKCEVGLEKGVQCQWRGV